MTVACYVRVSTAKQNLNRELTATKEYAEHRLGANLADLEISRDKAIGASTAAHDDHQQLINDVEDSGSGADRYRVTPGVPVKIPDGGRIGSEQRGRGQRGQLMTSRDEAIGGERRHGEYSGNDTRDAWDPHEHLVWDGARIKARRLSVELVNESADSEGKS